MKTKHYIIAITIALLCAFAGSIFGFVEGTIKGNGTTFEYNQLHQKVEDLKQEQQDLEENIRKTKEEKGIEEKYFVTFNIKQSHFTLDLTQHLKDNINDVSFEVMVDKDYYDSVIPGTVINDDFRVGSFVLYGSIGSWDITVTNKRVE